MDLQREESGLGFSQEGFNDFIINSGVIGFFAEAIKYKSGRMGNYYVNWRNASEDAYLMDKLTDFILDFIKDKNIQFDCLYGVPEGGTKLGVISQYKWAKRQESLKEGDYVLAMGRAKPKEHGAPKDKYFVGMPRGKTIVIEDTITTGGSLISTLESLSEAGVEVVAVVGLTDRDEIRDDGNTPAQTIGKMGFKYYPMSSICDLLPSAFEKMSVEENTRKAVGEYFDKYCCKSIDLGKND